MTIISCFGKNYKIKIGSIKSKNEAADSNINGNYVNL